MRLQSIQDVPGPIKSLALGPRQIPLFATIMLIKLVTYTTLPFDPRGFPRQSFLTISHSPSMV
jgi:hypothetical protein